MHEATRAIRAHHRELVDELAARCAEPGDGGALSAFVDARLLPHLVAEEDHFYPAIDGLVGIRGRATDAMRAQHEVIAEHARRLADASARAAAAPAADRPVAEAEVRDLAVRLDAMVRLHVAAEERVYLPVFEAHLPVADQQRVEHHMRDAEPSTPLS